MLIGFKLNSRKGISIKFSILLVNKYTQHTKRKMIIVLVNFVVIYANSIFQLETILILRLLVFTGHSNVIVAVLIFCAVVFKR